MSTTEAAIDPGIAGHDGRPLAIETRDVHKSFGSHKVLNGLNVQIPEGAASVLLGPSGTGKSVLISHILGLLQPDQGEVLVHGRSLATMSRKEGLELRRDVGVLFQDGALFSSMNVYDNVAFPLRQHTDLTDAEAHELVMDELQATGLEHAKDKLPGELSGGMKKRAGLARALVMNPSVLMCDEPDSGLDPVRTSLLAELLKERWEQLGCTLVVITHNMTLARYVADHMCLLWKGKVIQNGSIEEIFASEDEFVQQFIVGGIKGPLGMD